MPPPTENDAATNGLAATEAAGQPMRLTVLRCAGCGTLDPGPRDLCARCHSPDLHPAPIDARGALVSWTMIRKPPSRFRADGPYAVAVVDLDQGVRVTGRLASLPDPAAGRPAPEPGARVGLVAVRDGVALFAASGP